MSTDVMLKRIAEASPRFKARIAGVLYLLSMLTAASIELLVSGRLDFAAGLIEVSGMVAVTLLFYDLFAPVNRGLSLLAACFNLLGLTLEALRWNPQGVNIGIVFHGFYCILIGYFISRSNFLPRILGALMAFAGLGWLTFLSMPLANYLSPYNLASGFLGEGWVFLSLLVTGCERPTTEGAGQRSGGMAVVSEPWENARVIEGGENAVPAHASSSHHGWHIGSAV
jgi:hypothetical protein